MYKNFGYCFATEFTTDTSLEESSESIDLLSGIWKMEDTMLIVIWSGLHLHINDLYVLSVCNVCIFTAMPFEESTF